MMQRTPQRLALCAAALTFVSGALTAQQSNVREIEVPGYSTKARIWTEPTAAGASATHFQISKDGKTYHAPKEISYDLLLNFDRFDPARRAAAVPSMLTAAADSRLFIVQYWTQGLSDYRSALRDAGVEIHRFLPKNANIVEMDPSRVDEIASLSFVRTVTPFHPAFKFEQFLIDAISARTEGEITVNILTMRRGGHATVAPWIVANGGEVIETTDRAHLMVARIDYSQLLPLSYLNEVQWVDRWTPQEADMNVARGFHGTNFVETNAGFTGTNVRVEIRDTGFSQTHPDMPLFLAHGTINGATHGTSCSGIVVGKGIGNANARGSMPSAFPVFQSISTATPGGSRYNASAELVDPAGFYRCVLQTNSVGGGRTLAYTSTSQNMDLILFDFPRLTVTQSQSNANTQFSRPEAWAKNIISNGGINHRNTLTKSDDFWGGASIGPAADGRIKPDMASFYDSVLTTAFPTGYTSGFGGTSAATPINAGNIGLFYEMWSNGIFGNPTPGTNVFDNRPFNTTAKAVMINTADQWTFSGASANLARSRQGWGHADVQQLWARRNDLLIIDETDVIEELDARTYYLNVPAGQSEFKATMVYRDPPGTTNASQHRINDLSLTVVDPTGVVWRGNNGLDAGNFSTPGGTTNDKDTTENVFIQNPPPGEYRVIVDANEINQDSHVETAQDDADYALVVWGHDAVNPVGTARVITRTGGVNLPQLSATNATVGGSLTLTATTAPFSEAIMVGTLLPDFRLFDGGNIILIHIQGPRFFTTARIPGPSAQFTTPIVNDPNAVGLIIYCQAKLDNGPGTGFGVLTNSQDVVIGL